MSNNLHALIRYNAIDGCLQSMHRYSITDLMNSCSEAIQSKTNYRNTGVSERTVRGDISVMRSDTLGFNAPIACHRGNYFYTVDGYSIFKKPLQSKKIKLIEEVVRKLQVLNEFENDTVIESLTVKLESWLNEEVEQKLKQHAYEENNKTFYAVNEPHQIERLFQTEQKRMIPDEQLFHHMRL